MDARAWDQRYGASALVAYGYGGPPDPQTLWDPSWVAAHLPGSAIERAEGVQRPG